MYQILFKERAEKIFSKIDKKTQQKIANELEKLALDPFSKSNVKKISGAKDGYRLRISRWRILYTLTTCDKLIEVIDIFMEKNKKDYEIRRKLFLQLL